MTWQPTLEDLGRCLEAAAADAPPSPRMAEIRAAMLETAVADRRPSIGWGMLAAAAVILLAVALVVGPPAVGSVLEGLVPDREPGPPPVVSTEPEAMDPSQEATPPAASPSVTPATPSVSLPAASGEGQALPSPTPETIPSPSSEPSESAHPSGPPIVLPDPPIAIPTPPIIPRP